MELISLYLKQTPPLINSMRDSINRKDWTSLGITAHSIIPSFSIVGISKDFEVAAKTIQDYSASQIHLDLIPDLFLQLENVCLQACKELEEEFNTIKKANETTINLLAQNPTDA